MPSKKKKYNSRFPPARIKKIMQTDDEIGKVAAAVPVLISKCLEMFLSSILSSAGEVTKSKRAKTMSTSHLKECIMSVGMFDFLKDVVADVPDMQNEDEPSTSGTVTSQEPKKISRKRSIPAANVTKKRAKKDKQSPGENSEAAQDGDNDREDHNGGLLILSSPEQTGQDATSSEERKSNFHISLDVLMSQESSGPAAPCTDTVLHAVKPEIKKPREIQVSKVLADSTAVMDSSNGVSSPTKPIDLTVGAASDARLSAQSSSKAIGDKSEQLPHQAAQFETAHVIPTPLNMSHLYSPASTMPASVAPPPPRDLNSKVPQGGMLSLLYSGYPGNPTPPAMPAVAANVPGLSTVEPHYPYSPISEHYKRFPHSYLPPSADAQSVQGASRPSPAQHEEDDDYDV